MAVVQKRRKTAKSYHKSNPYPENLAHEHAHLQSDFYFNPALKTSQYSDKEHIENGGNPIFTFPIPKSDSVRANMLNDEVDMYFPRKHFLAKFQMNHDLLDNILTKPIPANKIIPPRMFPLPFVEGIPYEKKKTMLLQALKKKNPENPEINETSTQSDDIENKRKTEEKIKKENEEEGKIKEENPEEAKPDLIKNEDKTEGKDKDENEKKDEKKDENENTNQRKEENKDDEKDEQLVKAEPEVENDKNIEDENLSDYDPDFDNAQVAYPKASKEEAETIENYLQSRISLKEATDFLIGDLRTMQILETISRENFEKLEKSLNEPIELNENFKYNMKKIDELHEMFDSFTAGSIEEFDATINTIESEIKDKFGLKFNDNDRIKQFKTTSFDSIKLGISLDEYNEKYKTIKESEKSLNPLTSENRDLPTSASSDRNIDLNSKPPTNENEFYKSQSFDFDNNMMYESNTFGHDEDDDQFNSLNNQVFL